MKLNVKVKFDKKNNKYLYIATDTNGNQIIGSSEKEIKEKYRLTMSQQRPDQIEIINVLQTIEGYWSDEVYEKDENGLDKLVYKTPMTKNRIVVSAKSLFSGLLANESLFTGGITYHAIGEGNTSWDVTLPVPSANDTLLVNEYYRQTPDSISYRDAAGVPVVSVTDARRIYIRTTFDYETPSHPVNERFIRTQGLVGGNATSTLNTGFFLNMINHKAIFKTSLIKLIRSIEIRF